MGVRREAGAEERTAARRDILVRAGARGCVDELLAFNAPSLPVEVGGHELLFPLPDEAHLEVWREYVADAARLGAPAALAGRLVQLCFAIREGISASDEYRAATRRGELMSSALALDLLAPSEVQLGLHPSAGGTVPVLIAARRHDFVTLVRALSARNEPVAVPDSMGACIVSGLVNWDRVRRYRQAWQASQGATSDEAWRREFAALAARKELYQDRLILLSRGPYSGLSAGCAGLPAAEWEERSLVLRRAHECAHYLTLRVFGRLQHNVLEELVADFAGLVEAFGEYSADLARVFLGIESLPHLRAGGRLANYRGLPPLSDDAFAVEARLASAAVDSLAGIAAAAGAELASPQRLGSLTCSLVTLSLEELAATDCPEMRARLA